MNARRWLIRAGVAAALAAAAAAAWFWKPLNHGIFADFRDVDLAHVLACATRSNAAYHEPATIREEFGSHVEVADFPRTQLRVVFDANPGADPQWVVIRGTANLANIYTDMEFAERTDSELGISVHSGFDEALRECLPWIVERVDPERPICLTGHSLGGAVAVLVAAVLERRRIGDVAVVTFGQPKLTDEHGAAALGHLRILRTVYDDDPVPLVPPVAIEGVQPKRYHHFGAELLLQEDGTFFYLPAHDPDRLDVGRFWEEITHLRPHTHFLDSSYIPSLKRALRQ